MGCKNTQVIVHDRQLAVPSSYLSNSDSLNSADLKWQKFFGDTILKDLINVAIKNNLDLLSALQKVEILKTTAVANKASLFPSANLNTSFLQRKFGLYTMDGAGNITTEITPGQIVPIHLPDFYIGLQTNWEVDVWGKLRSKRKASLMRYLSGNEGKNAVLSNIIANVANSYFELQALDSELELIQKTLQLHQTALDLSIALKSAGRSNEVAVNQFKAQMLNAQAYEKELNQTILEVENKINFLLGRFPQPIIRKELSLNDSLFIQPRFGVPAQLLKNRPDIRQAEFNLLAAKADVKSAKAAFYPTLNITGAFGFQAFNPAFLFTTPESMAYSLLGSLIAPLINRNAIKAEFKNANALQQNALFDYQKSILTGYTEVYNEVARLNSLEEIFVLKTEEVGELEKAAGGSLELFKTGRSSYLEVLTVQQGLLRSKIELIHMKKKQLYTISNIYKALGGGWR
ncbi:MAG: TolC family protein [Bacteroidota bacterium]|jgi:NodT family efflux transporter outer membrane factor (OMF) lipoprotein|nr:TolC family protein [Bacteroidota bacterium]